MLYPLHAINLNILQVKGRSDLFLKLEIIKKTIAIGPIVIGILYGIEYMLWGSVVTSFVAYFLNSYYSAYLINYPTIEQIKDIFPTFLISLVTAFLIWSLTLLNLSEFLLLPLQIIAGIIIAFVIYEKTRLSEYIELKQLALSLLCRKK